MPDNITQQRKDYSESPEVLFKDLTDALTHFPDIHKVYQGFSSVLYRVLMFNTQYVTVKFKGTYAKLTHLLQEHNANAYQRMIANDMRVRVTKFKNLRKQDKAFSDELTANYLHDLEALCHLISLIYDVKIPANLFPLFPKQRDRKDVGRLIGEKSCLRMIVEKWDEKYVYGTIDDDAEREAKVSYTHQLYDNEKCSWEYLKKHFFPNCQLNLVRPRIKGGVIFPELIIFEPDCLINISEIAACFQSYATTPLNHLIRKLQPAANTEAILLGNFAGQLLDEEINSDSDELSYADSVRKFFNQNGFDLLATKPAAEFHREAQRQKSNISNTFRELPSVVKGYDKSQVILEPSFFSQMLGLQGRVDLMQQDFRFIIEQKSGKSEFPTPSNPTDIPKPQEQHYVQMLLYMALIHYNYAIPNAQISSFLLYSKYPNSLCRLGTAPELIFRAIKIRNGIAAAEDYYAKNGFHFLDTLQSEYFRQTDVSERFWQLYIQPKLAEVLNPIHNASPLERKYFHRMMRFVANEHLLAKVGSNQREDSGMAAIWLSTLDEKLQAGNIFVELKLVSPSTGHKGAVEDIELSFKQREENGMCNFRKGDIVILYPYKKDEKPDACQQIINRCTITELKPGKIRLHLRAAQSDARLFLKHSKEFWAVEHDFMESSYSSQYRGLHAMLTATKSQRDLILAQRYPEHDESINLKGNYKNFNELSLRVKRAKDLFLIIGPPGTGKTSYGMLNTLREQLTEPGTDILIVSYTNRAVDEICSKLVEDGIDFIRLGNPYSAETAYHPYLLSSKVKECENIQALQSTIRKTRVIVGTTTALCSHSAIFGMKHFDLLIVDEASQILEPHLLPILCAKHNGLPAIGKIVMIGDHKQLPAVVKQLPEESAVKEPELNEINLTDCRLSLFERFLGLYRQDSDITFMLTKQGRMHRDIAEFPNIAFYENKLDVVPLPHQLAELQHNDDKDSSVSEAISQRIEAILKSHRLAFIDVAAPDKKDIVNDKVNLKEAAVIAAAVAKIHEIEGESFQQNSTVGVIVPYRNQIATVRNAIAKYNIPNLHDITIDTVERFQGSQRDYIIYGFTVQRYYQLQFLTNNTFEEHGFIIDRKLNVAMTRARKHLLLTGDSRLLSANPIFRSLIHFTRQHNSFFQQ